MAFGEVLLVLSICMRMEREGKEMKQDKCVNWLKKVGGKLKYLRYFGIYIEH